MTGRAPPLGRERLRRLVRSRFPAALMSAVVIPVPEAQPALDEWRRRHPGVSTTDYPLAHATVMYPFLSGRALSQNAERSLAQVAAGLPAFAFALTAVGEFPGVVYLTPEPAEPFLATVAAVQERWPQCRPYGGRFAQTVPHVTVSTAVPDRYDRTPLENALPITCHARTLQLLVDGGRGMTVRRSFPLGRR